MLDTDLVVTQILLADNNYFRDEVKIIKNQLMKYLNYEKTST